MFMVSTANKYVMVWNGNLCITNLCSDIKIANRGKLEINIFFAEMFFMSAILDVQEADVAPKKN